MEARAGEGLLGLCEEPVDQLDSYLLLTAFPHHRHSLMAAGNFCIQGPRSIGGQDPQMQLILAGQEGEETQDLERPQYVNLSELDLTSRQYMCLLHVDENKEPAACTHL